MSTFHPHVLTALLACAACGSGMVGGSEGDGGSGGDAPFVIPPGLQTIEVQPAMADLMFEGTTPATQIYTAIGHFEDGHSEDLTSHVVFLIDNFAVGGFQGNVFTSSIDNGGRARVRAFIGAIEGFAFLTVKIKQRYNDPQSGPLPPDPSLPFDGPVDDARKPDLVYPSDGVLLPPNLGKIELHWLPGPVANNLFELGFSSDTTDIKIYMTCVNPTSGGCIFLPEPKVWRWLAESNRGAEVMVAARATDTGGTGVGTSSSMRMAFSQDDIDGGLYYWTTPKGEPDESGGFARIFRWDFASTTQTVPEEVITPDQTDGLCVGCHALSPDGRRLFVAADGSYNANVLLWDLLTGGPIVPFDSTKRVAFASWEWPDGARFVGTFGDENEGGGGFSSFDLNLYDGDDGSLLETIPVGGSSTNRSAHPDWSPDATMIAFTRAGIPNDSGNNGTTVRAFRSMIRMVKKDGVGWTAPIDLTASEEGKGAFYPAFSPDSKLVLFNRSSCADGHDHVECDMYDDPNASMWTVRAEAGAPQVPLVLANAAGKTDTRIVVQNSFAKWTPFTFRRTGELGKRLFWFTVSSDRNYGLHHPDPGEAQIWMAGFDPDAGLRDEDGSFPAFFLPFQEPTRDNHTSQWTRRVVHIP